ncbi:hypothetical protein [Pedobacter sp. ASV1-7]|uniref:hypothetical protein n=1 Tax=Pedobacter sp. ASV1-7 TaxID=3145237 RepID=UPI0032E917A4
MSSIYPEKWVFDGEIHRNVKINEAARNAFTFALNASAEAFVLLLTKKLTMEKRCV